MLKLFKIKHLIWAFTLLVFTGCGKEEFKPYDHPFIHIMNNNSSSETVNYLGNSIRTYNIYLSSKSMKENL